MPKKILELQIDQLAFGGEALASHEGKKIFIPWGVPGDHVKVEIIEDKKDFSRGKIFEILEKSPHRTDPPCPYFFKCGGCQWQQIQYSSQLEFKTELLKTALQRIGKISEPEIRSAIAAPNPFNYRNRIRLQVSKRGEVGFFRSHSKEIVPIEKCWIADERINSKISEVRELAKNILRKNPEKNHEIEIRIENEKVILDSNSSHETIFAQVNSAQNEVLQKLIIQSSNLNKNEDFLELFAGDGNFSFPISKLVRSVTAIESNPFSVDRAKKRAEKEHVRNIHFIESTARRGLKQLLEKGMSFNHLLLDPPRPGAAEVLEEVISFKIPQILYISCDPSTLARDVQILSKFGYRHQFSQLIDLFPQTYHIESITLLTLS